MRTSRHRSHWSDIEHGDRTMKRAVIYLRVSTEERVNTWTNDDGLSLSAQEEICRAHAHRLEAEVVEVYREKGVFGRKRDRRVELARLLQDIQTESVNYVIVCKLDRLARNTVDDVQLTAEIETAAAQLVSVMESFDEGSPQGWLMRRIFATYADEYEVRNSARRITVGMERKAELGGTPGLPPVGHLNVRGLA